jgi:hypothetical protein
VVNGVASVSVFAGRILGNTLLFSQPKTTTMNGRMRFAWLGLAWLCFA